MVRTLNLGCALYQYTRLRCADVSHSVATVAAQQTRTEDDLEPAGTNYSIGHIGLHAMPFNNDLVNHHFHNGVIESLDVHVDPPSLYKAQLAVRQGRLIPTSSRANDGPAPQTTDPLTFARL